MNTMRMRWRVAAALWCVAAVATGPTPVAAQDSASPLGAPTAAGQAPAPGVDLAFDDRAKAISSRLRCPVCQGESIQDSPAELATQMKSLVREQLAGGKSEKEVFDYFIGKYGQWILLEPRAEGINLLVYGLPILFIVGGGALLWGAVSRWTRPVAPMGEDPGTLPDD
jgi:cytochrome c-type biogenesis protein CcmH